MKKTGSSGNRSSSRSLVILEVIVVITFGVVCGVAATAMGSTSGAQAPEASQAFPVNDNGQSYGSVDEAVDGVEEPDLIRCQADNGKVGYCLKAEMEGETPRTSEEAEAIMMKGLRGYEIPVYEADGSTQIGVFTCGGPGSEIGGISPDGSSWSKTSNADGTITTTIEEADGTITKTTE